jgi:hypothetical protein
VLEVYATFRHRTRPPEQYTLRGPGGAQEHFQLQGADVFVDFTLANIGGLRAENVSLRLAGDFWLFDGQKKLSSLPIFRGAKIPQMAPAQIFPLFHIDVADLEAHDKDGKSIGMIKERFTIQVKYNGPRSVLSGIRRRKYATSFEFGADLYEGVLIPPRE